MHFCINKPILMYGQMTSTPKAGVFPVSRTLNKQQKVITQMSITFVMYIHPLAKNNPNALCFFEPKPGPSAYKLSQRLASSNCCL